MYDTEDQERFENYVGVKSVKARPMSLGEYNLRRGWEIPSNKDPNESGYNILYPDGYISWSPSEIFESAYLFVSGDGNKVTDEMVDAFIVKTETVKMGVKTCVVIATLLNGFEVTKSSSCVDPENYDEHIGQKIALSRIRDEVFQILGSLIQTAKHGFNH